MVYSDSAIWQDGVDLITSSKGYPSFRMTLELVTPDKTIEVTQVISRSNVRDFVGNRFDALTVAIELGLGAWAYDIFPHRKNLQAVLTVSPARANDAAPVSVQSPKRHTFKVVLEENIDANFSAANEVTMSKAEADSSKTIRTTLTLMELPVSAIRSAQTYGWSLRTSLTDLIIGTLMSVGNTQSPTKEQYNRGDFEGVVGVDVVPLDNDAAHDVLYVDMGTKVPRIASLLQDKYGLYNNGVGTYLHKGIWYVYPITNFTRFQDAIRRMVIYNMPKEKVYGLDSTFIFKGDELNLIAGGEVVSNDNTEMMQLNLGNAVKVVKSSTLFNDFITVNDSRQLVVSKATNVIEGSAEEREDGIYNPEAKKRISNNVQKAFSDLNKGKVQEYQLIWYNSAAELIIPGMPCRIYFTEGGVTKSIDGIVAGIQEETAIGGDGISQDPMIATSMLRILGERR